MWSVAAPVLYALFIWWFSTGVILWLDNLPRHTFRWSLGGATVVFAIALWRLHEGAADRSLAGAYGGFTYGVLAWGWQEMSFFMGVLTGPRRLPCPPAATTWQRFRLAVGTCIHHEIAAALTGVALILLAWGQPNQVGVWTFVVLWTMRLSSKLNVFAGVLNLNEQFVPAHLRYLYTYMRCRPMNLFFPFAVSAATIAWVLLVERARDAAADGFRATELIFVATMLALAILEHWFLVLPLPFARLWAWAVGMGARPRRPVLRRDIACPIPPVPSSR